MKFITFKWKQFQILLAHKTKLKLTTSVLCFVAFMISCIGQYCDVIINLIKSFLVIHTKSKEKKIISIIFKPQYNQIHKTYFVLWFSCESSEMANLLLKYRSNTLTQVNIFFSLCKSVNRVYSTYYSQLITQISFILCCLLGMKESSNTIHICYELEWKIDTCLIFLSFLLLIFFAFCSFAYNNCAN